MEAEHGELRSRVIQALPEWLVPLVQFNGLVAARLGITANELQCLYVLEHLGPSTAGELARRVNLTSGSASRMIDRLVARGYATRRPDPADRRRVLVATEPAAIERVSALYAPLNERLDADLEQFDAAELGALLRFVLAARYSTEAEIRRI